MSTSLPADRALELAGESRFLTLCRIGFLARGLLYMLIALLVLQTGRTEDFSGAFEYLNAGAGRLLLIVIAIGLGAYGLWRLADAALGIENGGVGGRAHARRVAAGGIGLLYLYLTYKAVGILLAGHAGSLTPHEEAAVILDLPGGSLVMGLLAIGLLGGGVGQLWFAKTCRFLAPLDRRAISPLVKWLGRIGYAARGVIFTAIGLLIGGAAIDGRSAEAGGMEQALDLFSRPLLFAVAIGLFLFGIFSIVEALYRRLPEPPPVAEIKREMAEKLG